MNNSTSSSRNKFFWIVAESLDDDWERDFDVEVTEDDLQLAQEKLKTLGTTPKDSKDDKVWFGLK